MLKSFSKFFLYASLFAVVVVMNSTFFPFIGGKYYFFRTGVELALVFLLLWWAFEAKGGELQAAWARISSSPLFWAVTAFSVVYLLSCVFAYDPHAAFWSNYERADGGFQFIHYYLWFVLSLIAFTEEKDWTRAFKLSLVAAALMILYGVGAAALLDGFIGPYRQDNGTPWAPTLLGRLFHPTVRFQGSLGNPAYVAPYLLFSMFYALWLWGTSSKKSIGQTIQYSFYVVVFLVFFVLSQTRGAFLGLGAAVAIFFLYLIFSEPSLRKKGALVLAVLALGMGLLFTVRDSALIRNLPGSRFLTISLKEQTAQTRFWTWNSAWKGFKERPLFGWGPENFSAVFDKYFDPRHYIPGANSETWFDRAHSIIFDYLSETGIVGFVGYLAVFVVFYWQLAQFSAQKFFSDHATVLKGLLGSILVAYLVQGLFLFDVLPIYMNLFAVLAFAVYLFSRPTPARKSIS